MLSSGRGGDSFSHTPCIMFASFRAARAATCSAPGRIFNYFSRPWHLAVRAALAFATGASPTASFNGANSSLWRSFSSPFREGVKSTAPFASFRGNCGVKRAARGFCEHKSTQQLWVRRAARPLKQATSYGSSISSQRTAPDSSTSPRGNAISWPFPILFHSLSLILQGIQISRVCRQWEKLWRNMATQRSSSKFTKSRCSWLPRRDEITIK